MSKKARGRGGPTAPAFLTREGILGRLPFGGRLPLGRRLDSPGFLALASGFRLGLRDFFTLAVAFPDLAFFDRRDDLTPRSRFFLAVAVRVRDLVPRPWRVRVALTVALPRLD